MMSHEELELSSISTVDADEDEPKDTTVRADARPAPPLVSPTASGGREPAFVPGAIFRATLDRTHWLTFGYERDHLPVFLYTSRLLAPSEEGDNPVAFVGDSLTIAGFIWPDNTERFLRGSVWVAVENVGRGRVVLFAENPLFRAFWRAPSKLVTNAMLMGPRR